MNRFGEEPRRNRKPRLTLMAVGGILLLGLGLFVAREKRLEVKQKRAQLATEGARLEELREVRDSLREWKVALESEAWAVEEAIRRKLHWVRPGERVLTWRVSEPEHQAAPPRRNGS